MAAAAATSIPSETPNAARAGSSGSTRSWATGAASSRRRPSPPAAGPRVEYRFRNGKQVEFTAHEIKVEKLLDDVKAYLKSNPQQARLAEDQHRRHRLPAGRRRTRQQYLGRQVAQWQLPLEPRENHFDKRVTVTTPLQKPGAYLLTAKMAGGNTSYIVVWVDDTAIVKKPLAGKTYYFVADAVTGQPIAKANVEFFGWQQHLSRQAAAARRHHQAIRRITDADGQVIPDPQQQPHDYPVAHHRPDRRGPVRLSRLHRRLVRPTGTTPSTTPRRSTRSPTGRSIGPSRR